MELESRVRFRPSHHEDQLFRFCEALISRVLLFAEDLKLYSCRAHCLVSKALPGLAGKSPLSEIGFSKEDNLEAGSGYGQYEGSKSDRNVSQKGLNGSGRRGFVVSKIERKIFRT